MSAEEPGRVRIEEATFVELVVAAQELAETKKLNAASGEVAREFSIALHALEDAQMRYTRGLSRELGVFKPVDLESEDAIAERRAFLDHVEAARNT